MTAAEMREAALNAVASVAGWSPYVTGSPESKAWIEGRISSYKEADEAIRAIPMPDHAAQLAYALAMTEIAALMDAAVRARDYIDGPMDRWKPVVRQLRTAIAALEGKQ